MKYQEKGEVRFRWLGCHSRACWKAYTPLGGGWSKLVRTYLLKVKQGSPAARAGYVLRFRVAHAASLSNEHWKGVNIGGG